MSRTKSNPTLVCATLQGWQQNPRIFDWKENNWCAQHIVAAWNSQSKVMYLGRIIAFFSANQLRRQLCMTRKQFQQAGYTVRNYYKVKIGDSKTEYFPFEHVYVLPVPISNDIIHTRDKEWIITEEMYETAYKLCLTAMYCAKTGNLPAFRKQFLDKIPVK